MRQAGLPDHDPDDPVYGFDPADPEYGDVRPKRVVLRGRSEVEREERRATSGYAGGSQPMKR